MAERRIVIDEADYPNNSFRAREERQKEQEANESRSEMTDYHSESVRKELEQQSRSNRTEIDEDSWTYFIVHDMIAPAAKDFLWRLMGDAFDIIREGLKELIFGKESRSRENSRSRSSSYHDYTKHSARVEERRQRRREIVYQDKSPRPDDPSDVVFRTPYEAENALEDMRRIADKEGFVRIADFFIMTKTPTTYTDYEWGWKNLDKAYIMEDYGGFYIRFPESVRNNR